MIVFLVECSATKGVWRPTQFIFESLPEALRFISERSARSWDVSYRVVRIQKDVVQTRTCYKHTI